MEFLVSEQLLNRIAQYIAKKPYEEVAGMMSDLAQLKPYETDTNTNNEKDVRPTTSSK